MEAPRRQRGMSYAAIGLFVLVAVGIGRLVWREQALRGGDADLTSAVGGPFRLVDQDGRAVDQSVLTGRWSAVFFGYTFCPDVCPATLTALKAAKAKLGAKARNLQVIFISIDPQRDTPAQLKTYLATPAFPQPSLGLTGSPEQVAAVAKAYKVYYAKEGAGADYQMAHSSAVYLMDPRGRFSRLVSDTSGIDAMAAQIGAAIT